MENRNKVQHTRQDVPTAFRPKCVPESDFGISITLLQEFADHWNDARGSKPYKYESCNNSLYSRPDILHKTAHEIALLDCLWTIPLQLYATRDVVCWRRFLIELSNCLIKSGMILVWNDWLKLSNFLSTCSFIIFKISSFCITSCRGVPGTNVSPRPPSNGDDSLLVMWRCWTYVLASHACEQVLPSRRLRQGTFHHYPRVVHHFLLRCFHYLQESRHFPGVVVDVASTFSSPL